MLITNDMTATETMEANQAYLSVTPEQRAEALRILAEHGETSVDIGLICDIYAAMRAWEPDPVA